LGIEKVYITNVFPIGRAKTLGGVFSLNSLEVNAAYFEQAFQSRNTCGVGSNLHITPEGDIYPCWAFLEEGASIGHVRDGLRQATHAYRWGDNSQYSVDKREKCKACDVRYLCGGICRAYKDTDCTPLRQSFLDLVKVAKQELTTKR
jgi:uncharacterized protein